MTDRYIPGKNAEVNVLAQEGLKNQRQVWNVMDKTLQSLDLSRLALQQSDSESTTVSKGADVYLLERWMRQSKNRMILELNPNNGRVTLPIIDTMRRGRIYTLTNDETTAETILSGVVDTKLRNVKVGVGDIQAGYVQAYGRINAFIDGMPLDTILLWDQYDSITEQNRARVLMTLRDKLKPNGEMFIRTFAQSSFYAEDRLQQTIASIGMQIAEAKVVVTRNDQSLAIKAVLPQKRRF